MKNILTLYDFHGNAKTGRMGKGWMPCILDFDNNNRVPLANISIRKGRIYHGENKINLNDYGALIFNYGEDYLKTRFKKYPCMREHKTYADFIAHLVDLKHAALKLNPDILIYNDPENQELIVNSRLTYETFKNVDGVNVPSVTDISSENIDSIKTPIVVTRSVQSGGYGKFLCRDTEELKSIYKKLKKENKSGNKSEMTKTQSVDFFACDYLDAHINEIGHRACIRLFVINNKLAYYLIRPSKEWNIHAGDQSYDKEIMKTSYMFLSRWLAEHEDEVQKMLNALYDHLGYGLYCHDFLLHKGKLFLCELSYKSYDHKTHTLLNKHKVKLGCLHEDQGSLQKTYRKTILNSIINKG